MEGEKAKKPDFGREHAALVTAYIYKNYAPRGLVVRREVQLGTSIIGKKRHVDLLLIERSSGKSLALEYWWQDSTGTTDEKIPYALQDVQAMPMPAAVVYAGTGLSRGVVHLLQCSGSAVYCLPDPHTLEPMPPPGTLDVAKPATWELDSLIAMTFSLWDLLPRLELAQEDAAALQWPNLSALLDARGREAKRVTRAKKRATKAS